MPEFRSDWTCAEGCGRKWTTVLTYQGEATEELPSKYVSVVCPTPDCGRSFFQMHKSGWTIEKIDVLPRS